MAVKGVDAIKRALLVLEGVAAGQPIGISQLARSLGLTKSSTQRALVSLADAGWIEESASGTGWVMAPHALAVVMTAMRRVGVREALLPALTKLRDRSGETSFLALVDDDRVVLVEVVESTNLVRVAVPVGSSAPASSSSAGLAIAAFLETAARDRVLGSARQAGLLEETLAGVRRRGYATQFGAVRDDIHTLAVPVFGEHGTPVAALGLCAPADRMTKRDAGRMAALAATIVGEAGFGQNRLDRSPALHGELAV